MRPLLLHAIAAFAVAGLLLPPAGRAVEASRPTLDFGCVGYQAGAALPGDADVPVLFQVVPTGGDDTALLQAAIDELSSRPIQDNGFRGALLLAGTTFKVSGQLHLRASGVVLRGSSEPITEIWAIGQSRRTLIVVGSDAVPATGEAVAVVQDAAAGAAELVLADVSTLAVGDRVVVRRPSTSEWIAALGMDQFTGNFANLRTHWLPGSRDLVWDRVVTAIDPASRRVSLDAPITTALEARFGGGMVAKIVGRPPISRVGIEQVTLRSEFDPVNPLDEEHAWDAIGMNGVEDAWVTGVSGWSFAGSVVHVGPRARRVTVQFCNGTQPVSELAGFRRRTFFVEGQQVLVDSCAAMLGLEDFTVGGCAAGPNVFRGCLAHDAQGPSGAFESWASGVLFDHVTIEGQDLRLCRDDATTQGGGIVAHNAFALDCVAREVVPAASNDAVPEPSIIPGDAPVVSRMSTGSNAPLFHPAIVPDGATAARKPLSIVGGRFVADGRVVWGGQLNAAWWKGQTSPAIAATAGGRAITRFVPGREGPGLTEDLEQLADDMVEGGMPFYNGGPGLWYDRRRDDHLLIERSDACVWAPFYEMPWARSGQDHAWDGLSRFDLTKFNPWYFQRSRDFAEACARRGMVFYNSLYNTHNVFETLAHWVDYPWRPENNINDTGLPVPQTIDERNTIHIADQVYDVSHPGRRELHRAFIRHHLDVLGDVPNVVHILAFQFAGPLSFQEFFLDTVAEWERETGRDVKIALATSKDITDAILADPARAALVDVIDMRYWQVLADGTLWAPRGDVNRAFREQNTELFGRGVDTPPDSTPLLVYRYVRDYRDRFPDKAVVAWHGGCGAVPVLMAGGAQVLLRNPASGQSQGGATDGARLDAFVREHLAHDLMRMTPRDGWLAGPEHNWCLANDDGTRVLVASLDGAAIRFERALAGRFAKALWFDPASGETRPARVPRTIKRGSSLDKPTSGTWLLLLPRED